MVPRHVYLVVFISCLKIVSSSTGNILLLSDIHYDPYYGTFQAACNRALCGPGAPPLGTYGCDAPLLLVNQTIAAAKSLYPNPDFIVFSGDIARHDMVDLPNGHEVMNTIIRDVGALLDLYFPNVSRFGSPAVESHAIVFSIGNNDVLPSYELVLNASNGSTPMLKQIADAWANELSQDEYIQLARGGFFQREIVPGIVLLSLNTLLYSVLLKPSPSASPDPGFQFAWLTEALSNVRTQRKKAIIVGHIPPVLDSCEYAHTCSSCSCLSLPSLLLSFSHPFSPICTHVAAGVRPAVP
jgi:hypothetical protein